MDRPESGATAVAPVCAVLLSVTAAACLGLSHAVGIRTDTAEAVSVLTWLIGWVLLSGAVIVGGAQLVSLTRRTARRRPVRPMHVVLVAASLLVSAAVVTGFPLWGTGSAAAP